MSKSTPHVGDVGTIVQLTFTEPDLANPGQTKVVDISTATAIDIKFRKPDQTTVVTKSGAAPFTSGDVQFVTDGIDGKAKHTVDSASFWSDDGEWDIQGVATFPTTGPFSSDVVKVRVARNL